MLRNMQARAEKKLKKDVPNAWFSRKKLSVHTNLFIEIY